MLKKVLIAVGILALLIAGAYFYLDHRNRTLSPAGKATATNGDLTVQVDYSRPSVRNRLVFGPAEEEPLQAYGQYWRLGANEATEISFNKDVKIMGQPMAAGRYSIYAIPGEDMFQVVLNTEVDKWGYSEADHSMDVLTMRVPVAKMNTVTEQYTMTLEESGDAILLNIDWANIHLTIPVE